MPEDAIEVVKRCLEAWDRTDLEGVLAQNADDAVVDSSDIGEGVYSGLPAVRDYYRSIFESYDVTPCLPS